MAAAPLYEPHLDLPLGSFRWRLGLRALDLTDWLQYDGHAESELAYKRLLLDTYRNTVFVVEDQPDVEAASREILATMLPVVPERWRIDDDNLHPLDAAGRMVQEDLVVMVQRGDQLVCGGGSVCFPNRWDLRSKVGHTMAQIHAPVPDLNEQIGAAIDQSLDRLTPERAFWRLGWTIVDTDELYQAVDGTAPPPPTVTRSAADHWLRVERETLRRFPRTGCVLFTIRTYLTALSELSAASRHHLGGSLDAMTADVRAYKALDNSGQGLIDWLTSTAPA